MAPKARTTRRSTRHSPPSHFFKIILPSTIENMKLVMYLPSTSYIKGCWACVYPFFFKWVLRICWIFFHQINLCCVTVLITFRIVYDDWDYSHKNGFKCTFEGGILRLYFNFKRLAYRRWITREGRLLKIARPELWSLIMNLIISELNIHSFVLYLFFFPSFCYWLLKP